jgi:hypothetical protein
MSVDESFKVFGLISIVLTWVSIGYILLTVKSDLSKSISHHAALKRKNYLIFCSLMLISLVAMLLFMFKWFIPTFHLPLFFSGVVMLAILSEIIATVVPLTTGWRFTVHQITSYGTSLLFPILLITILFSSGISKTALYITFVCTLLLFGMWLLFFFVKKTHAHYLIFQSLYIVAFHTTLIATTYSS